MVGHRKLLFTRRPGGVTSDNPLCTSSDASCNPSVFQNMSSRNMHMLFSTRQVLTNSSTFFKCTSSFLTIFVTFPWAFQMLFQRTCGWNFERSSSCIPPELARFCGPWRGLTSRGDMGMPHHQPMRKTQIFQPCRIGQSRSFLIS